MKLSSIHHIFLIATIAFLGLQSCTDDPNRLDFSGSPAPFDTTQAVSSTTLPGNTTVYVIEEGDSPFSVVSRDVITVRFTARTDDGQIFDGSFIENTPTTTTQFPNLTPNPIQSRACRQRVCLLPKGLRRGLIGMVEGERRTIVVPPSQGYTDDFVSTSGRSSENGVSVQGETLIYDVELVNIL